LLLDHSAKLETDADTLAATVVDAAIRGLMVASSPWQPPPDEAGKEPPEPLADGAGGGVGANPRHHSDASAYHDHC
jgi:hypothetical protein